MNNTYYKVVSVKRRNKKVIRTSWLDSQTSGLPDFLRVRYIPGKPTKPKVDGTKLMVFDRLGSTYPFAGKYNQVWECTVTNPTRIRHVKEYRSIPLTTEDGLKRVWNVLNRFDNFDCCSDLSRKSGESIDMAPAGAFACDTVTLTQQVR